jgi:hypothetical protein
MKLAYLLVMTMATITATPLAYGDEAEKRAVFPEGYVDEAPLPDGFPPPSEVGKVVEKTYPASRTYSASGTSNTAFFKLFGYLALQQHKMTAPVIVEVGGEKKDGKADDEAATSTERQNDGDDAQKRRGDMELPVKVGRMHFVLEKPTLDKPKNLGLVKVADMPQLRVLSIASRGDMTPEAVKGADKKLRAEIERRGLKEAGSPRLLGYNGPDVPAEKRYWEYQIPVSDDEPATK